MLSKNYITLFVLSLIVLFTISCEEEQPNEPKEEGDPCSGITTVTYEEKVYNTVEIGSQCWLKENLDVGTKTNSDWGGEQTDNGTIEKYCYDNVVANCNTYGGLYLWDEAMQYVSTEGARGICPEDWHIPTDSELRTLRDEVGSNGNGLKAVGQGSGNGAGTNTSGFSALLGGSLSSPGNFSDLSYEVSFWSSTESSNNFYADLLALFYDNDDVYVYGGNKNRGYSIRCIKD